MTVGITEAEVCGKRAGPDRNAVDQDCENSTRQSVDYSETGGVQVLRL